MLTCLMQSNESVNAYPLFGDLNVENPTSPKQMVVFEIDVRTAQELNYKWHSLLPKTDLGQLLAGGMTVCYGAMFADRYYAVGIWSQPIIASLCDGTTIELRRLAICAEAPKNTASWMLSRMRGLIKVKWPHIKKGISYQACDVHHGTIYKASGWHVATTATPARPQRFYGDRQRATAPLQTTSAKIRWEVVL